MRVGINLINFGPAVSPGVGACARPSRRKRYGYHFMMLGDHVTITPDVQGRYPAPFYDPFTTLGWLAGLTRRVELGFTVIVLPYRHPLETARMAATLDQHQRRPAHLRHRGGLGPAGVRGARRALRAARAP